MLANKRMLFEFPIPPSNVQASSSQQQQHQHNDHESSDYPINLLCFVTA
jgi:hypothetical protein